MMTQMIEPQSLDTVPISTLQTTKVENKFYSPTLPSIYSLIPGAYGIDHFYWVVDTKTKATVSVTKFHQGQSPEKGWLGTTIETELVILIHRLEQFQANPVLKCPENANALHHVKTALLFMNKRNSPDMPSM